MPTLRLFVCAFATAALFALRASAANRKVDVVNQTGKTLTHFYASSSTEESWQEDMLANDTLDDGETLEADIDDGSGACIFDFKGVFEDGATLVKRKVSVCTIGTFTFK